MAVRASRAEARRSSDRGICSRSPSAVRRPVQYGKSNCTAMCFGDFCRSFLPERTSQPRCDLRSDAFPLQNHVAGDHGTAFCFAAVHPAHGSPCGESSFRQKGPTSARTFLRHGSSRALKMAAPVMAGLLTEPFARPSGLPSLGSRCGVRRPAHNRIVLSSVILYIRCPGISSHD